MNKKLSARLVALALVAGSALVVGTSASGAASQGARPGDSPNNPIIVASPDDVPAGAVQTGRVTLEDCSTTTTWRLTLPGTDETSHQEFRYTREVPGVPEQSHKVWGTEQRTRTKTENMETQYRFRTRVPISGEKEVKEINGWNFGGSGTTTVNGFTIPGRWYQSPGWHEITSALINAVWYPSGNIPESVLGQGNVSLSVYGGPSVSVSYRAHVVQTNEGFTPWSNWSEWSTSNPGDPSNTQQVETRQHPDGTYTYGTWGPWTERSSGELSEPTLPANTDTRQYRVTGPTVVIDTPAVDGFTEYFVLGGEPSRDRDDASWIRPEQLPADQDWEQFDERTVVTEDGTPEVVTYYAYNDGYVCETPDRETPSGGAGRDPETAEAPRIAPSPRPAKPSVPLYIDAGL